MCCKKNSLRGDQVAHQQSGCPISRGPGLESHLCCVHKPSRHVHTLIDSLFMLCSDWLTGEQPAVCLTVLNLSCFTQTHGFILSVCFIISSTVITLVPGQVDRCCCNSGFCPNRIDFTACLILSVVVCTPDHLTWEHLLDRWTVVLTPDGPSFNRM